MGNYFVPSHGPISWKEMLKDPKKQWKKGYSAFEMANCWENAKEFPSCVESVFKQSNISLFNHVEMLYGFPEFKVELPGGKTGSQNDLYVLAKANDELLTIMVEGKVSESFGKKVITWLGDHASEGKRKRLQHLLDLLNLQEENTLKIRYQLLHRTASALTEASRVHAKHALMLVHSFSDNGKGFEDFSDFVRMFDLIPAQNEIIGPVLVDGKNLYFGWVNEEK